MAVPARVSLITLGVADLHRSTGFYRALGWPVSSASVAGEVSFFRTAGAVLALWGHHHLAADTGVVAAATTSFRAVALAINVDTPDDVDAALQQGGSLVTPAHTADWGGYSGYFADPDGHLWEVAHNPLWPIDPDQRPTPPCPEPQTPLSTTQRIANCTQDGS